MTSRLDRLVTLLETGSTQLIRNTAAQQLADIQKKHADELFNLLTRVVPFVKSKSWDARTAAAKAIGGIVEHAAKFDPNEDDGDEDHGLVKTEDGGCVDADADAAPVKVEIKAEDDGLPALTDDQLQLKTLDVAAILAHGKKLLGSAGREYDYHLANMEPAERLNFQKKTLNKRLGLAGEYMDEDLVDESDFKSGPRSSLPPPTPGAPTINTAVQRTSSLASAGVDSTQSPHDPLAQTPVDDSGLSKRQINALKRKNKREFRSQANKVRVVDFTRRGSINEDNRGPEPTPLRIDTNTEETPNGANGTNGAADYFSLERKGEDDKTTLVKDFKGIPVPEKSDLVPEAEELGLEWPFERLCEFLMVDLFDHNWEVRHGAAMALREIVRIHGAGAGREHGKSRQQNNALNQRWLDDLACRLCCVFMLDRFGDYISDNVVAPVRESVGQTLGALLPHLSASAVHGVYEILSRLVMQNEVDKGIWQACQGGMIGMRYLVAVRSDLLLQDETLLDGVLQCVMKGLGDWDDDVRAVSAATLIPVSGEVIERRPSTLNGLITIVWDCLSNLSDDLSASTGSVMDLLAKLCNSKVVLDLMQANAAKDSEVSFAELVPRLYPFLRHTITTVRSAVLRALLTFLEIDATSNWIDGKALRLVFQNLLVERNESVLKLSLEVWMAMANALARQGPSNFADEFAPHVSALNTLTLTAIGVARHPIPMDATLFLRPSGQTYNIPQPAISHTSPVSSNDASSKKRRRSDKKEKEPVTNMTHNIDAPMIQGDIDLVGTDVMIRSKIFAATALGKAMSLWPTDTGSVPYGESIVKYFTSPYSTTELTVSVYVEEYAKLGTGSDSLREMLLPPLQTLVEGERPGAYADLVSYLHTTRAQCQSLLNTFRDDGHLSTSKLPQMAFLVQGEHDAGQYAFSIADAEKVVGPEFEKLKKLLIPVNRISAAKRLNDSLEDAKRALEEAKRVKEQRDIRIKAGAAAALVAFQAIPKKPALTIKGLMDSIKTEETLDLQKRSAGSIVSLIKHMVKAGKRGVVDKIVGNLVKFCCMETAETPEFHPNAGVDLGILSLKKEEDVRDHADAAKFEREARAARIMRRGAREALEQLAAAFGQDLFNDVPSLRTLIESPLKQLTQTLGGDKGLELRNADSTLGQEAIDAMSTIKALAASFHPDLHPIIMNLVGDIVGALKSNLSVLRYAAAKSLATICSVITVEGFSLLVEQVLPSMKNAHDVFQRQGVIECVYHLIHVMEDRILPYVIFLIVPVLGRMSDSDGDIRLISTTAFATLVKLVPLEAGIPDPPGLSPSLLEGRDRERKFMAQMLDFKKLDRFEIPVAIKATLRSYQQEGVDWLAFLNRYQLHGILCDDMGLGKTLQTLCIVASDHHMRAEEYAKTESPDARRLPSLIVCPPTLSGHWQQEIRQFAPFLTSVAYVGPPSDRQKLRSKLTTADIVITSYENCRNDIDVLVPLNWNYCVLDEGHLIKNPAAKTTVAVKRLASNHRLILSGTPIQNNVTEMWSLFDFLMPGFLGTEKVFRDRFAKPIAASRFSKSSSREQEAGALAAETLHKQVLPFLMRRLKEEVLDDLPPKILQNYYCDLSDLQRKLFEDFTKKEGSKLSAMASAGDKESKQHIFTALNYMRKLCNSPALVVKEDSSQYPSIQKYLSTTQPQHTSLRDVVHAPKLTALRDLLVDLGIGNSAPTTSTTDQKSALEAQALDATVSPHRALIFCQMKEMLDMVEHAVLRALLPRVQSLRLDGSVEASKRQDIVNKFNSDPSYDVLLLTTSVGGLGLNLTGADTVIFVEHDWNPQRDIQAMDRAHRIGQKKVVNVFRLITRATLEEKILSLQRFKIDVASQVVNQQNAGLASMQTDQILDLFTLGETLDGGAAGAAGGAAAAAAAAAGGPGGEGEGGAGAADGGADAVDAVTGAVKEKGKRGFLDELGELWDERQYEEYNMDEFLKKMKT